MTMDSNTQSKFEVRKEMNKEDMKQQFIVFALTIFLTILAFAAVLFADTINTWFIAPFILVLAIVQVMFQLFYFMHMSHKGHEAPALFIFSGILFATAIIAGLSTIVWW
ncbi:cytochrome c oxidase subunit IVB [Calidifontibacillus erzurumensis]|uniref:Cytochrome c oxidase subunit IVB n=1 Tax=Calidifontibacillus erzurumensis TaxID=2741433 RepID=A0A8J8GBA5_9BACI|nr:cytochrome c oxidase subunit IVB [Calidifontibacillus erzurumensis]NSL50745.1 cytochrome c oxidase subunit IVB [Calidifontibacillus erzurumensis]